MPEVKLNGAWIVQYLINFTSGYVVVGQIVFVIGNHRPAFPANTNNESADSTETHSKAGQRIQKSFSVYAAPRKIRSPCLWLVLAKYNPKSMSSQTNLLRVTPNVTLRPACITSGQYGAMKPASPIFVLTRGLMYIFGWGEKQAVAAIVKACRGKFNPGKTNYARNNNFENAVELVNNPPCFDDFKNLHGKHPLDLTEVDWKELADTQRERLKNEHWVEVTIERTAKSHVDFLKTYGLTTADSRAKAELTTHECVAAIIEVFKNSGLQITEEQAWKVVSESAIKRLLAKKIPKTFDAFWKQYQREKEAQLEVAAFGIVSDAHDNILSQTHNFGWPDKLGYLNKEDKEWVHQLVKQKYPVICTIQTTPETKLKDIWQATGLGKSVCNLDPHIFNKVQKNRLLRLGKDRLDSCLFIDSNFFGVNTYGTVDNEPGAVRTSLIERLAVIYR